MDDKNFRLEYWYIHANIAWGKVYNNPKFKDGHFIHTSRISEILPLGDDLFVIKTANSEYYVRMSYARFEEFDSIGRNKIIGFEKFENMYSVGEVMEDDIKDSGII